MWVYIWSRLPSEYQEVEYIGSSWTQWIDTWVVPTSNTKVSLKTMVTWFTSAQDGGIYWVWYNHNTNWRFGLRYGNWDWYYFWYWGNNWYNYRVNVWLNTIADIENYVSSWTAYNIVNWTTKSYSWASFTQYTWSMYIFRRNNGSSSDTWMANLRIYYFKVYESWTLVRDFVPCYRKSDSVIGLYDLVNNQFYTNSWSGIFSKWSDVNNYYERSMQNAYIGEVYEYSYDFRNKSNTTLTNDGWTFPDWTTSLGFDSNWMYNSSTSRRWAVRSIDLNNARKITYTANTIQVSTKNVWMRLASDNTGSTSNSIWFAAIDSTIYWVLFWDNTASANPTGNIQGKIIADLENKSLVMYDWSYSKSFTLTDANVTKIRWLSYLLVCAFKSWNYIQDINITVEY